MSASSRNRPALRRQVDHVRHVRGMGARAVLWRGSLDAPESELGHESCLNLRRCLPHPPSHRHPPCRGAHKRLFVRHVPAGRGRPRPAGRLESAAARHRAGLPGQAQETAAAWRCQPGCGRRPGRGASVAAAAAVRAAARAGRAAARIRSGTTRWHVDAWLAEQPLPGRRLLGRGARRRRPRWRRKLPDIRAVPAQPAVHTRLQTRRQGRALRAPAAPGPRRRPETAVRHPGEPRTRWWAGRARLVLPSGRGDARGRARLPQLPGGGCDAALPRRRIGRRPPPWRAHHEPVTRGH